MPAFTRPYNIARHNTLESDVIPPKAVISLGISPNEADLLFLQHMFNDANWKLYEAHTYREAMSQPRACCHIYTEVCWGSRTFHSGEALADPRQLNATTSTSGHGS